MSGVGEVRYLVNVRALITLQSDAEKREQAARFSEHEDVVRDMLDSGRYRMYGSLGASLSDRSEVSTGVRDLGFAGPKDGLGAIARRYQGPTLSEDPEEQTRLLRETYHVSYTDVVDSVNAMLGRDLSLDHHPHLAWGNLIKVLADARVTVSEEDLIKTPFELVLSAEVKAEIRMT